MTAQLFPIPVVRAETLIPWGPRCEGTWNPADKVCPFWSARPKAKGYCTHLKEEGSALGFREKQCDTRVSPDAWELAQGSPGL